jgi:hypothetical protein
LDGARLVRVHLEEVVRPVIVSIVSTRFCTPASFSVPPAALVCRYRSIRQPMVALST